MDHIRREVPVLPVPLVAAVFDAHPRKWMTAAEIERKAGALLDTIAARGVNIYQPGRNRLPHYVAGALGRLQMRHFIEEEDGRFRLNAAVADIVRYYANSIAPDLTDPTAEPPQASGPRYTDAIN